MCRVVTLLGCPGCDGMRKYFHRKKTPGSKIKAFSYLIEFSLWHGLCTDWLYKEGSAYEKLPDAWFDFV